MACPNCLWPLTNLSSEIAISSTTHNTATADCHITTTDWLEQLGEAIHAVWPERFVRYSKVAVLMLSWEDGDIRDTSSEFVRLRKVFKDEFHYEVEEWPIPPKKSVGRLSARVQQFVDTYDKPDNLLIVYYAGHARRCEPAGSFPVWRSKWKPDEGHEADTAAIYPLLTGTDDDAPDALMLSDCCHALCAHYPNRKPARAVVETLCAGGFDSEVPIPGPDSFTTALIDELSNAAKSPFPVSVPELHKEIVRRLEPFRERAVWNKDNTRRRSPNGDPTFTKDIRRTPVHLLLSVNRPTRTIFLETTRHKASTSQNGSHNNASWRDKTEDSPSVLLVVRVLEDEKAVSEQVARWVKDAPAVVVDFKGFYRSFSTLILVQVPFAVWDMLPPCAAVSFAGFLDEPWQTVRSQELCGTDYRPTGYQARGPFDGSAALSVDEANKPERSIVHSAPSSSDNAQTTSTSIQATNRSSEEQLFMPRTTNQKTLMALLDSADKILPSIFATWKTKQVARNIEGLLFEEFRQRLNNSGMNSNIPDEAITLHQEFLMRYLSARELVEHDDPLLNISGRLNPKISWRFYDEEAIAARSSRDVSEIGSMSGSVSRRSSGWTRSSAKESISIYAPSIDLGATSQRQFTSKRNHSPVRDDALFPSVQNRQRQEGVDDADSHENKLPLTNDQSTDAGEEDEVSEGALRNRSQPVPLQIGSPGKLPIRLSDDTKAEVKSEHVPGAEDAPSEQHLKDTQSRTSGYPSRPSASILESSSRPSPTANPLETPRSTVYDSNDDRVPTIVLEISQHDTQEISPRVSQDYQPNSQHAVTSPPSSTSRSLSLKRQPQGRHDKPPSDPKTKYSSTEAPSSQPALKSSPRLLRLRRPIETASSRTFDLEGESYHTASHGMAEWSVGHQAATFDRLSPNLGDTYDSLSMTSSDESANPKPVYPSRKGKKVYRREPGEVGLESSENLDDDNRSFDPSNDRMLFDAPHGQKDQASYGHFEPDDPHISMIPGQIQPEYSRATSKACNKVGLSKQSYERHLEGESSSVRTSSPYAQAPEYPTEEDSFDYGDPSSSRNSHKKVASHTKRMTSIPEDAIADKEGEVGYLDQEYKVEPSWKFHPGAVCKVLWSEPVGVPTAPGNQEGADFIVSYRRFIVVATDEGHHSTCVPILTYERKGCNKKGVKASQHGIIYSKGQSEPRRLKGEPTLGYPPVAVTMSVKERLPKESRVNYAKLVTIEHNVKVLFIGTVEDKYFETVEHAVNGCWETKERHQLTHKHSRHGKQPRK